MRRTRRDQRYLLSSPWEGTLRIPGEVLIERHDEEQKELWVLSGVPAHREELLTLDLSPPARASCVWWSRPVLVDGSVRHRLRPAVVDRARTRRSAGPPALWRMWMKRRDALQCQMELAGVLARHLPTRLIEISRSGCLLECGQRIEEGTVGGPRLEVRGQATRGRPRDTLRGDRRLWVELSGRN